MTDLRDAARQALNSLRGYRREIGCEQPCDAERALEVALAEEALQRLTDVHQEIEVALEQPKFTLSCGCPSQHGGIPAYWDRDGSTAFGMICEKHWHQYGARSEA